MEQEYGQVRTTFKMIKDANMTDQYDYITKMPRSQLLGSVLPCTDRFGNGRPVCVAEGQGYRYPWCFHLMNFHLKGTSVTGYYFFINGLEPDPMLYILHMLPCVTTIAFALRRHELSFTSLKPWRLRGVK